MVEFDDTKCKASVLLPNDFIFGGWGVNQMKLMFAPIILANHYRWADYCSENIKLLSIAGPIYIGIKQPSNKLL